MTLLETLSTLEKQVYDYGLSAGSSDLTVAGSVETGHIIDTDRGDGGDDNGFIGACCYPEGFCRETTLPECNINHGQFLGFRTKCFGTLCYIFPTEVVGACCFFGGGCVVTLPALCIAVGGFYAGDGTTCAAIDCPDIITGACCCPEGCVPGGHQSECGASCTFHGGGGCDECGPIEPTGACCQTPTSLCVVTTESNCFGLFHEGVPCDAVGTCDHDFCGPTAIYCGDTCDDGFHDPHSTNPHCCSPGETFCACCFNAIGGFYYTCCCHDNPPFGTVCE